jgi:hypothetical protein
MPIFTCHHSHRHQTTNSSFVIGRWWSECDNWWHDQKNKVWWQSEGEDDWWHNNWKNEVLWCVHDDNFVIAPARFISQYHPYLQIAHSSSINFAISEKKSQKCAAEILSKMQALQKGSKLCMVYSQNHASFWSILNTLRFGQDLGSILLASNQMKQPQIRQKRFWVYALPSTIF